MTVHKIIDSKNIINSGFMNENIGNRSPDITEITYSVFNCTNYFPVGIKQNGFMWDSVKIKLTFTFYNSKRFIFKIRKAFNRFFTDDFKSIIDNNIC